MTATQTGKDAGAEHLDEATALGVLVDELFRQGRYSLLEAVLGVLRADLPREVPRRDPDVAPEGHLELWESVPSTARQVMVDLVWVCVYWRQVVGDDAPRATVRMAFVRALATARDA